MAEYGLADVSADVYQGAMQGEVDRAKMDSMRKQLFDEGFQHSMKRLAMGDTQGAQEEWNKTGKHRIKDLNVDDQGQVTWTSIDTGQQHQQSMNELATLAGVQMYAPGGEWKKGHKGQLFHTRTGERMGGIPGGGAASESDVRKYTKDIRGQLEKTLGKALKEGGYALDPNAQRLYTQMSGIAETLGKKTGYQYSAGQIVEVIRRQATPFLIDREEAGRIARGEEVAWYIPGKRKLSVKDRTDQVLRQAKQNLKDLIDSDFGIQQYAGGVPGGIIEPPEIPEGAMAGDMGAIPGGDTGGIPAPPAPGAGQGQFVGNSPYPEGKVLWRGTQKFVVQGGVPVPSR